MISYLDVVSPEANAIGAVNVIKVEHRGEDVYLKGYNSDVIGFTKSIEPYIEPYHKKALILGTGGASKAINFGLKSLGLETAFVSRYERPGTIQYEKITPEVIKEYNVIVNCTPVGMYPHVDECPALPYEAMDSHTLLYDLIYNPSSLFLLVCDCLLRTFSSSSISLSLLSSNWKTFSMSYSSVTSDFN